MSWQFSHRSGTGSAWYGSASVAGIVGAGDIGGRCEKMRDSGICSCGTGESFGMLHALSVRGLRVEFTAHLRTADSRADLIACARYILSV